MYIEGIKYANLIELSLVIIEIRVENDNLAVPVSTCNTLVCHTAFLATDTQPSVLITYIVLINFLALCIRTAIHAFQG